MYSGCLLHGVVSPSPPPPHLFEREWRAKRRRLLLRPLPPSPRQQQREPSLEEVARLQDTRREARQRFLSGARDLPGVRRSASTSLPRRGAVPHRSSSSRSCHRHSLDLGAGGGAVWRGQHRHSLDLGLVLLPVAGGRVTTRQCDELPEEFRRAGIGACFRGEEGGGELWNVQISSILLGIGEIGVRTI